MNSTIACSDRSDGALTALQGIDVVASVAAAEDALGQSPFRETRCDKQSIIRPAQSPDVGEPVGRHVVVRRPAVPDLRRVKAIIQKALESLVSLSPTVPTAGSVTLRRLRETVNRRVLAQIDSSVSVAQR